MTQCNSLKSVKKIENVMRIRISTSTNNHDHHDQIQHKLSRAKAERTDRMRDPLGLVELVQVLPDVPAARGELQKAHCNAIRGDEGHCVGG